MYLRAMTSKNVLLFCIIVLNIFCQTTNASDSETMPALYKFDNYYECMNNYTFQQKYSVKYCMVLVQLQPNQNSSLWQHINEISKSKFHYRHDHIFRGVCMDKCKHGLENNRNNGTDNGLLINAHTEEIQKFINSPSDRMIRSQFQGDIHECINQEYLDNYNLSTKAFINYCIDTAQRKSKDIYFTLTIILIIIILLLNIFSSLYDAKLKTKQLYSNDKDTYYEIKHNDKVTRYLTSCSLFRNFKRLVLPNKSDIGNDLAFLDGFRAILCLIIISEHMFLLEFMHLKNTDFIETVIGQLWFRMVMHAIVLLELFFVLSGLLLYIKFEKSQYISSKSSFMDCVTVFGRLILSRYLRYLPSLLFIIIVQANISYYHEHGAFTRLIMEANCWPCREYWWQNVLMFTNYKMKMPCLMHLWYIAADFQLYCFFIFILIIIAKFPEYKTYVLVGISILVAAINCSLNYFLKLDSIFMLLPENYRYFYLRNSTTALYIYFSSYTNINSFLLGVVCGLIYMKYLHKNEMNKREFSKILKYSPYLGWTCICAILYLGTQIMEHTETTIWTASYGLLQRHVGLTIVVIIVILRGMCNGGGIFKSTPFRYLARISYQIYLWHFVIFFNFFALYDKPIYIDILMMVLYGLIILILSVIISCVVVLFVEYPFAEILDIIDIERKVKSTKTG